MSNPNFILAFFMIVVGLPVIAGILGDIYKRRLRFRERQLELESAHATSTAAQTAARTRELEQRVRILEQIVTDGGAQTAAQIEALRDHKRLESGEHVQ